MTENATRERVGDSSDSPLKGRLRQLRLEGRISALDWHFASFMEELGDSPRDELLLAALLLSYELAKGNVCIDLRTVAQDSGLPLEYPEAEHWRAALLTSSQGAEAVIYPLEGDWQAAFQSGVRAPLVLEGMRLYLNRYWQYECALAEDLGRRAMASAPLDADALKRTLAQLFGSGAGEVDWQQVAAAVSVTRRFSVISGGPGTGKTTTVTKLLLAMVEQFRLSRRLEPRIRLAAPTGKAAARLTESIKQAKRGLVEDPALAVEAGWLAAIPEEAATLHRLLGWQGGGGHFRYHRDNPLSLDLLVLDEASMVDLPMMAHLLEALPEEAQLILLGDRDQLASVEAGSVLGDICGQGLPAYSPQQWQLLAGLCDAPLLAEPAPDRPQTERAAINNSIGLLRHSYRFAGDSGIGQLASAVNAGDVALVRQLLAADRPDLNRFALGPEGYRRMLECAVAGYTPYLQALQPGADFDPRTVLDLLGRFQVLCALQQGDYGAEGLNARIERALRQQGLIRGEGVWYAGRPVMVTRNDYGMRLFNGDIGVAMPDPARNGEIRVCFENAQGELRWITPGRMPQHSTVFAMTVHKSQGSEFDHPLLVLPPEHRPLVSRELLYTGITRARKRLGLMIGDELLERALGTRTHRVSGLAERLWGTSP
ncbi:exodeoxyribonuclease V subunit alpha [Aestuariirhabdus litorea]|uniref:RecBCD enzyme subunit RecD n=1 Tax=Aestuariirhabdus litorea TaxID=2528527 RepID=A0A3P3VQY9_9GAMM|nr:exodeoxyribonuclease V subunit alpha [Aestuariirhabdus litorea]RRJ85212.1 exodeoxyribonuclease V subunit alpha [Aestuariirhabdus litorea]RWW98433.1 exodeoxyribonuclease V subunit alpha [Endozoicomonadaceae bacterium GTF-13]